MSVISPADKWPETRWSITIFQLPYICFYIQPHISVLVRFGSFRGCTRGEAQYVCKSVPAVSHKFKSGLSVSKEMGFSAAPVRSNLGPISKVEHTTGSRPSDRPHG